MIEKMAHVVVVAPAADQKAVMDWLYKSRQFHLMPASSSADDKSNQDGDTEEWGNCFKNLPDKSADVDANLTIMQGVMNFCQEFRSNKPGFLDSLFPMKTIGSSSEITSAVEECEIATLQNQSHRLRQLVEAAQEEVNRRQQRCDLLKQFSFLGDELPGLLHLRHFQFAVIFVNSPVGKAFLMDERIRNGDVMAELLLEEGVASYYALSSLKSSADKLKSLIDDHGLNLQSLPEVTQGIPAEMAVARHHLQLAEKRLATELIAASTFADEWCYRVELSYGYWESEKTRLQQQTQMVQSGHLFVARGYALAENLEILQLKLENAHPGATLMPCDAPVAEEMPPTSLKWANWLRPSALIVKMYGLPVYNSIDPTIFVATIFYCFVGICLGDVAYGVALIAIMAFLKRRYREQQHLVDFFQVFTLCGYSTIFFGACMGSWISDLPARLHLFGLQSMPGLIDPIADAQLALYISIGIGLATQFYGMGIRVYRDLRRGDCFSAFADGILWMIFFSSLIVGGMYVGWLLWITLLATIGLILTQGREEKGLINKAIVGVVSLYGIVGSYGVSGFLGDVVSFARLMALAMTTAALGSTFNLLADMCVGMPYIGGLIGLVIILGGHSMNFALGILGAFVHSARLMMLEFFGRFYEPGGYAFQPYGFASASVGIRPESKVN